MARELRICAAVLTHLPDVARGLTGVRTLKPLRGRGGVGCGELSIPTDSYFNLNLCLPLAYPRGFNMAAPCELQSRGLVQVTGVWLSADSPPRPPHPHPFQWAISCHFRTFSPSIFISPAAPFLFQRRFTATMFWVFFIAPPDKLRDTICTSHQLAPGLCRWEVSRQVHPQTALPLSTR